MENPHLFHALVLKVWSLSQSISKTWEFARNANAQAPETCFKKPCRGCDVHFNALEKHKKSVRTVVHVFPEKFSGL